MEQNMTATHMGGIQSASSNNMHKGKIEQHDPSDKTRYNSGYILRQV